MFNVLSVRMKGYTRFFGASGYAVALGRLDTTWYASLTHPARPEVGFWILTALTSMIWAKGEPDAGSQAWRLPMVMPPSTTMCVPVTKAESSLARYRAARATSSGRPGLGIGWAVEKCWATRATIWSATSRARPMASPKMEVAIRPGQMA